MPVSSGHEHRRACLVVRQPSFRIDRCGSRKGCAPADVCRSRPPGPRADHHRWPDRPRAHRPDRLGLRPAARSRTAARPGEVGRGPSRAPGHRSCDPRGGVAPRNDRRRRLGQKVPGWSPRRPRAASRRRFSRAQDRRHRRGGHVAHVHGERDGPSALRVARRHGGVRARARAPGTGHGTRTTTPSGSIVLDIRRTERSGSLDAVGAGRARSAACTEQPRGAARVHPETSIGSLILGRTSSLETPSAAPPPTPPAAAARRRAPRWR